MPFTTAPRPLDVVALWPELAELARTAVRLHPRPGKPTAEWAVDTLIADSAEARRVRDEGEAVTPMIPLAQLFASEVAGLPFAGIADLLHIGRGYRLQLFYCGTDPAHALMTLMT